MLKIKKIGLGIVLALLLLAGLGTKALAASRPTPFFNNKVFNTVSQYTMQGGQITATLIDNSPQGSTQTKLTFVDSNPNDTTYQYLSSQAIFCNGQTGVGTDPVPAKITFSSKPTGKSIDGHLTAYVLGSGSSACTDNSRDITVTNLDTGTGGGGGLPSTLTYNGQTYHIVDQAYSFYGLNATKGSDCYGGSVIVANSKVTSGTAYLGLTENSGVTALVTAMSQSGVTDSHLANLAQDCNFTSGANTDGYSGSISNGKLNAPVPGGGGGSTTPVQADNSCEANYTGAAKEFNWIFCAALRGVDGIVNFLDGQIQGYLFLCTGTSQTTGETCSTNLLPTHVYQVWSIFRILATSLLVVILLVMVIAQAMGGAGPIDAYTIRKILPRVVIAAIFMQISWYVFKYVIDLSNDAGKGIADLMFYPFGGAGSFSLDNLVGGAGKFAPGITVGAAGITTAALIAFGGLTTIGWMFLGVSLVASLFTGLLVLVIRQLIVIMCMMIVPLALVAWILPGTKRYWDMWKDNFTKVLFMFPMIMAMIAGGRIFAYLGSQQGGFTGLIIVLGGYFFPYFYLPKTFKWGGQAFGAISSGVWQGTQKYRAAPGKLALQEAKGNREQRAMDRAERLANNRGRTFDRLFAGHYNYLRGSTTREHHYQDVLEKGRKAADEAAARSVIGSEYERMDHPDKVATDILVAQGRLDPRTGMDGRHAATQRAALDRLAKYGDWDAIAAVREGGYMGEEGERVWQDFVAKNISAIHQNMPHLSPQRTNLSQVAYREFQSMKDDGWDEVLRQASTGQNRDGASGLLVPSADPEGDRRRFVEQARRALDDTQFMASVGAHGRAVLEQVARMPVLSPEVQLVGGGRTGGPSRVYLPDATAFGTPATASTAIDSVRQNMFSAQPGVAEATRRELARAVGSGTLSVPERDAYENLLSELKVEATHSTTARSVYNATISGVNDELSARVRRAEQQAIAGGLTPAQISAARSGAQAAASNDRARMVANGLTPY